MNNNTRTRALISLLLAISLLSLPITAFAKKGDKNFKRGMDYEKQQQWDKAAQEYTLAVAADPSNMEYQLHFRRASFNASQTYMQQGRSLAERGDYVGAYNAFRQAYGYDPVNELAVSEMDRMLRLQAVKEGRSPGGSRNGETSDGAVITPASAQAQDLATPPQQQLRVVDVKGDLKQLIRTLAEQLNLNVIFDRQSFAQSHRWGSTAADRHRVCCTRSASRTGCRCSSCCTGTRSCRSTLQCFGRPGSPESHRRLASLLLQCQMTRHRGGRF